MQFCKHIGHTIDECRKKEKSSLTKEKVTTLQPNIHCYKCKAPGYVRSNCPNCKELPKGPSTVSFNCMKTTLGNNLPTITIQSHGESGIAYVDTAARTSVAGRQLFIHLMKNGTKFQQIDVDVTLADGQARPQEVFMAKTNIIFSNRLRPITFIALPTATDNRTLIGIDFLEENGIVLDLGQRLWYYADQTHKKFDFYDTSNTRIVKPQLVTDVKILCPPQTTKAGPQVEARAAERTPLVPRSSPISKVSAFLSWFNERKPISPLASTPKANNGISSPLKTPLKRKTTTSTIANNDYSPGFIEQIFNNSLRSTDLTPERGRENLFPPPTQVTKDSDPDSWFTEINSIDVSLRSNEAQELSQAEKQELYQVLTTNKGAFNKIKSATPYATHKIDTGNHEPVAVSPYRLSPTRKEQLKQERIFKRLETFNLKVNRKTSNFCCSTVNGIQVDPEKVTAIINN
ncbi:uncharacterized protein LOC129905207 [Episyrphus balteatus]|uniref:uncharacterized protein LOC129905207 n=1 Tax=Episyrphus balteatus TaxID=286459 RepID=UPI0024853E40|nr:uncharacterized protein LOC129905207 [Episyrphus balteatus]